MHPAIIGIVNLTQDSFSDGGLYLEPAQALERARGLVQDGASAVDLGPASSHPDAEPVSSAEEIRRLEAVAPVLLSRGVRVSIDSFQPETQRWALRCGVDLLNDIEGFRHPELYAELARSDCELVVMHSLERRGPATRTQGDAGRVYDRAVGFFEARVDALEAAGIARERLILDPGMGFFVGAEPGPSLELLRRLPELRARFGLRVLVSVSRKSFLGSLTGQPVERRGPATLAAELAAARRGVDLIRTHDVRQLRDALLVAKALGELPTEPALY